MSDEGSDWCLLSPNGLREEVWGHPDALGTDLLQRTLHSVTQGLLHEHTQSSVAGLQLCGSFELQRHLLSCMNSVFSI